MALCPDRWQMTASIPMHAVAGSSRYLLPSWLHLGSSLHAPRSLPGDADYSPPASHSQVAAASRRPMQCRPMQRRRHRWGVP